MKFSTVTSTIPDGNMSLRFGEEVDVLENRKRFLATHAIAWENHLCMRCDHGAVITTVTSETQLDEYRMLNAEVLVTNTPGLALMLLTADCLPATLFDPVTGTLALAHFSRQTITAGLPEETISFLRQAGVAPENLMVTVGPYIHTNSYRFTKTGEPFAQRLLPYLHDEGEETVTIDLLSCHNDQLTQAGVLLENITGSPIDTVSSPEHFSHHESTRDAQKPHGRLATISWLS